jgi:hypothetical protein
LHRGHKGSFANKMQLKTPFNNLTISSCIQQCLLFQALNQAAPRTVSLQQLSAPKLQLWGIVRPPRSYSLSQNLLPKKADSLHHDTIITVRSFAKSSGQGRSLLISCCTNPNISKTKSWFTCCVRLSPFCISKIDLAYQSTSTMKIWHPEWNANVEMLNSPVVSFHFFYI